MRKRFTLLLAIAVMALVAPAARADFHPACTSGGAIVAFTNLKAVGDTFEYSGYVECHDSTITISSLTLTPLAPLPGASSGSVGEVSCSGDVCSSAGTAAASPGLYKVSMVFTATGAGATFTTSRVSEWAYSGDGQPLRTCPSTGFRPPANGCV